MKLSVLLKGVCTSNDNQQHDEGCNTRDDNGLRQKNDLNRIGVFIVCQKGNNVVARQYNVLYPFMKMIMKSRKYQESINPNINQLSISGDLAFLELLVKRMVFM